MKKKNKLKKLWGLLISDDKRVVVPLLLLYLYLGLLTHAFQITYAGNTNDKLDKYNQAMVVASNNNGAMAAYTDYLINNIVDLCQEQNGNDWSKCYFQNVYSLEFANFMKFYKNVTGGKYR